MSLDKHIKDLEAVVLKNETLDAKRKLTEFGEGSLNANRIVLTSARKAQKRMREKAKDYTTEYDTHDIPLESVLDLIGGQE